MSDLYFPSLEAGDTSGDTPLSEAELQGALCGLLCMDALADRNQWYKKLFTDFEVGETEHHQLTDLFDKTVQSLNSLDFDFEMALPDDDSTLISRLTAMAQWCQGLIYGLGTSGMTEELELSKECQEYISDTVNIGQVNFDDIEETEEEEANFQELVEYLRMGLFLLYGELQPNNPEHNNMEH